MHLHHTDPETALREALAKMPLPTMPAQLDLQRFTQLRTSGQTQLNAVVRLTWPPGMRQRGFNAQGGSTEIALADLLEQIETTFARVGRA